MKTNKTKFAVVMDVAVYWLSPPGDRFYAIMEISRFTSSWRTRTLHVKYIAISDKVHYIILISKVHWVQLTVLNEQNFTLPQDNNKISNIFQT
jgi:predicted metalloprotease